MVIIRATGHTPKYTALALYERWLKQVLSSFPRVSSFIVTALFVAGGIIAAPVQALAPGGMIGWGDNTYNESAVPTGLTGIIAVAAGGYYSLALKGDGTVMGWGLNSDGQTDIPAGLKDVTAIAAGYSHNLALKKDGTVVAWGGNAHEQANVPASLTGVTAIAAGYTHSLALKSDGSVVAWGYNLGSVPADLTGVTAIAAGYSHSLALKSDGTVVAWGLNFYGQTNIPVDVIDVAAVALGHSHSLALKRDGTVVAWGSTANGRTTIPASLTDVSAIAAGYAHSLALKKDGTVVAWGGNDYEQANVPAGLTGVTAIAAGYAHSLAANLFPSYTFSGFLEPVNNPDVVNSGKAGRTYPIKWQLKDASGAFISRLSVVASITFKPAQCGAFSPFPVDALEADATGGSELRYDADSNMYIFNWKAPSPGCYTFLVTLDNGQVLPAYFYFVK